MYDYRDILGKRIKELRGKVSQDSLCDRIEEITGKRPKRSTLSDWEKGKTCPDIDQVYALADIFDVDMSYLLGDCDTYRIANQKAVDEYGLSELAFESLRSLKRHGSADMLDLISKLIEDENTAGLRIDWMKKHPEEYTQRLSKKNYWLLSHVLELCMKNYSPKDGARGFFSFPIDDKIDYYAFKDLYTAHLMTIYNDLKTFIADRREERGLPDYS